MKEKKNLHKAAERLIEILRGSELNTEETGVNVEVSDNFQKAFANYQTAQQRLEEEEKNLDAAKSELKIHKKNLKGQAKNVIGLLKNRLSKSGLKALNLPEI